MKTKLTQKQIRFQALLLFFITFFLVELCAGFLYQNQLKEAKLKADYTAQTTIGRVKSQLNHYLAPGPQVPNMHAPPENAKNSCTACANGIPFCRSSSVSPTTSRVR